MYFRKEYSFLSNMYHSPFTINGTHFKTVEHFYQSNKTENLYEKALIINAEKPTAAKAFGKKCHLVDYWSVNYMLAVMKLGIRYKFENHLELQTKLLAITEPIIEDNDWGDTFWGICNGYGINYLGKLLTEYKTELEIEIKVDNLLEEKAVFKYNSGKGALLCDNCKVIIKEGKHYSEEEKMALKGNYFLPKQYCEKCKEERII